MTPRLAAAYLAAFLIFSTAFAADAPKEVAPAEEPLRREAAETIDPLAWRGWSDDLFVTAKKENKLVILDLEAVWCHWCHVMAETTYRDPEVARLIGSHYIPVRVDQDADPEISLRYEEWGWPATIIFSPDGQELVKRRGYIPPAAMASLLDAVVKDPTPGPSVRAEAEIAPAPAGALAAGDRKTLEEAHQAAWDETNGGWGTGHKLIDWPSLEYAMTRARGGDKAEEARARRTLDLALNLLDREWGGFFQYSDQEDWKSPHYEKIMSVQAQYLRAYSLAYAIWKDPRYLEAAEKTADYVGDFWTSQDDSFFTSQDADVDAETQGKAFYSLDDAGRRKLAKRPRIDTHLYARENGWMIASLASLHSVTGQRRYLVAAERAATWVLENRALSPGAPLGEPSRDSAAGAAAGFRHDAEDRGGPYLGDTLAMGQAFLALYASSGDREWLARAREAADFISLHFRAPDGGLFSAKPSASGGPLARPIKQIEENVNAARWANALYHHTGRAEDRAFAEHAMKYLASPALVANRRFVTGILLADRELASDPDHVTVIGPKDDPAALELYKTALAHPFFYRRIEWWDPAEGPLPRADVEYPELEKPAAFLCTNGACSTPFFTPEKLLAGLARLDK